MRATMQRKRTARRRWSYASRIASNPAFTSGQRARWLCANAGVAVFLLVGAVSLSVISLGTDLDLTLADHAFDARAGVFPLRQAWVTTTFNHVILRHVLTALAVMILLVVARDLYAPRAWSWLRRFQLHVIALSALLIPSVISLLKQTSVSHCPWDLQRYGGSAPYIKLFELMPAGVSPGHCMPAGHASSALWLISLSILFVPQRLLHAACSLTLFLFFGIGVGWLQQLRGAHFFTHTLWSAWIAMLIVFLIAICLDRWPIRAPTGEDARQVP